MSEKQTEDIASRVVDKLKEENGFRGCPLTRDEQGQVKHIAALEGELQELVSVTKKGKKYFGILFVALIMLSAKGMYESLITLWHTVAK